MPPLFPRLLGLAGFLCLLSGTPLAAQETPRSIGECERLKNDLAYNQCLSMFGPAAKNIAGGDGGGASAPPVAAAAIPMAEDAAPEVGRGRRGRARYGRRGRQVAVFTAGGGEETRSYRRRRRR
ncbi:hypothetical protein [Methylobacterium oxalidis]|uniref:Uncharacterized protein n=1 Tax=Methylobacterium oxalidis TaxID=944322 RepID=A0A512J4J9_9HYPH|nr:hypothetical protein [Methylobacterium oxalidis]GEP04884.1 hypothetical protein MOX02_29220 [Methylobacterium oxalidis]GJE33485.1 hypothetical protein LDDCCGHA_3685 [Methylobacterium oxalidis]GLS67015.1 hypothetical protein GCM10007888_53980 [Methylobacterium oxalidis]